MSHHHRLQKERAETESCRTSKHPEAHAAKGAALQDAQVLANVLLDVEAKFGAMLAGMDKSASKLSGSPKGYRGSPEGTTKTIPPGITKKESHQAQTLARHPEVVEMVKRQAVVKGELPTAKRG